MDTKTFYTTVSRMRQAQNTYFQTRSKDALQRSKQLEKAVDNELARINAILKAKNQPPLS